MIRGDADGVENIVLDNNSRTIFVTKIRKNVTESYKCVSVYSFSISRSIPSIHLNSFRFRSTYSVQAQTSKSCDRQSMLTHNKSTLSQLDSFHSHPRIPGSAFLCTNWLSQ